MSMLARYRKPGGIEQLVSLLESCLQKKRELLLNTIGSEDKEFANMVKNKLLTPEKLSKWDPMIINEVTSRMNEKTLAIALRGFAPAFFDTAIMTLKEMKKRDVKNFFDTLTPSAVEIESAQIKFIEKVRELIREGAIKLDENDKPISQMVVAKKAG